MAQRRHIVLSDDLNAEITALARVESRPIANLIRLLLREALEARKQREAA